MQAFSVKGRLEDAVVVRKDLSEIQRIQTFGAGGLHHSRIQSLRGSRPEGHYGTLVGSFSKSNVNYNVTLKYNLGLS